MNNYDDFRKLLMGLALQQSFERVDVKMMREYAIQKWEGRTELRQMIECSPNIETAITDTDMLLWRIDMALDNRDEVAFDLLVQELEGVK